MGQITDPRILAQIQAQQSGQVPTAPMPFPGARPLPPVIPTIDPTLDPMGKTHSQQTQDVHTGLDINAGNRAEQQLDLSRDSNSREQGRYQAFQKGIDQTGGTETTAEENKAAGLTMQMKNGWDLIQKIQRENPGAVTPSLREVAAGTLGKDFITNAAIPPEVRAVRMNLNGLYRQFVQNAIYQASGAAFQQDELENMIRSVEPNYWDNAQTLEVKKYQIESMIAAGMLKSGKSQAALDGALKSFNEATKDAFSGGMSGQDKLSQLAPDANPNKLSGENQDIPVKPEYQQKYSQFLRSITPGNMTPDMIRNKRQELDAEFGYPVGEYADSPEMAKAFNEGHLGEIIPPTKYPLSGVGKAFATAAADPGTVGDAYAGAVGFSNAMSGGITNPFMDRQNLEALKMLREAHPDSSTAGDVIGSSVMGGLAEGALASKGLGPVAADIAANMGYGGVRGASETNPEDSRLLGAVEGAGEGLVGSLAGRALVKGAKGFISPRKAQAIEELTNPMDKNVLPADLTTMMRAGASSTEEAAQGFPGVARARESAVESWNRQNSSRVLARIGETLPKDVEAGQASNKFVTQKLGDAYDAIRPQVKGAVDTDFNNALTALKKSKVTDANRTALWGELQTAVNKFKQGGTFDGDRYKELMTQLRRFQEVWGKSTDAMTGVAAQDMAQVASNVRKQVMALAERNLSKQGKPEVLAELRKLDGAWAHQARINTASRGAAKGTRGVYSPDQYLSAIERGDTSLNKSATAQGTAFDQPYAQNAREVIGGTPAKHASTQGVAATGFGLRYGGIPGTMLITAVGAGYAPGVKRIIQAIVDGKVGTIGNEAIKRAANNPKAVEVIEKIAGPDARKVLLQQYLRVKQAQATGKE